MIRFQAQLPDARLRQYVKMYFWGLDDTPPLVQRVVPNGEMGLLFYRGNKILLDGVHGMQSCIKGQSTRYHDIVSQGGIEVVGAHFTALGANIFFRTPLSEFYETTAELSDTDDLELTELERMVISAESHTDCWNLMETFFLQRLSESEAGSINLRRLRHAMAYGLQHIADASICDLASEACVSRRQFDRLFHDFVGLPPKDFFRLQRYRQALLDLKRNNGNVPMTEIALRNGYYDYSHFSADIRKITGYAPGHLLRVSKSNADSFGWRL